MLLLLPKLPIFSPTFFVSLSLSFHSFHYLFTPPKRLRSITTGPFLVVFYLVSQSDTEKAKESDQRKVVLIGLDRFVQRKQATKRLELTLANQFAVKRQAGSSRVCPSR